MSSNHQYPPSNHQKKQSYGQVTDINIKTGINPVIPWKFGPKNEIYSQCYEIWHCHEVKFVNLKYDFWKLQILTQKWVDLDLVKLQCVPTFMKFGTSCKSNILIMNMVPGIDDLDPKL